MRILSESGRNCRREQGLDWGQAAFHMHFRLGFRPWQRPTGHLVTMRCQQCMVHKLCCWTHVQHWISQQRWGTLAFELYS